ncbi:MAG: hypothetical protein RBR97_10315 [Bacteroidales bacterium]|nr:hypothetical protein [Bacteroidales bacterium]
MKYKYTKLLFTLIVFMLLFSSCEKEDIFEGIIVKEFDTGYCLPPFGNEPNEYIITNDSLYQDLLTLGTVVCEDYTLPEIDFAIYSLLGKFTVSDGEVKYYKREVIKDVGSLKYTYKIYMKCKNNSKAAVSMNWVLVPKLPAGYSVEFIVNKD